MNPYQSPVETQPFRASWRKVLILLACLLASPLLAFPVRAVIYAVGPVVAKPVEDGLHHARLKEAQKEINGRMQEQTAQ